MTSAVLAALTVKKAAAHPEPVWTRTRRHGPDSLAFDFKAGGSSFTLELVETGSGVALSVTAPTDEARRILRNALVVVPHLDHRSALEHLAGPGVQLVDVREGVEAVVAQIAGAQVCISSSLHGIIVAQAYGVPWVWLRISDLLISGDTFEFEDFFTTLDAAAVSTCNLPARSLTQPLLTEVAARASLPETTVDVGLVLESFPFRRACIGAGQFTG